MKVLPRGVASVGRLCGEDGARLVAEENLLGALFREHDGAVGFHEDTAKAPVLHLRRAVVPKIPWDAHVAREAVSNVHLANDTCVVVELARNLEAVQRGNLQFEPRGQSRVLAFGHRCGVHLQRREARQHSFHVGPRRRSAAVVQVETGDRRHVGKVVVKHKVLEQNLACGRSHRSVATRVENRGPKEQALRQRHRWVALARVDVRDCSSRATKRVLHGFSVASVAVECYDAANTLVLLQELFGNRCRASIELAQLTLRIRSARTFSRSWSPASFQAMLTSLRIRNEAVHMSGSPSSHMASATKGASLAVHTRFIVKAKSGRASFQVPLMAAKGAWPAVSSW